MYRTDAKCRAAMAILLAVSSCVMAQAERNVDGQDAPTVHAYQNRYAGQQVVRVSIKSEGQLRALEASGAVVLDCHVGVGKLRAAVTQPQRHSLIEAGIVVETLHGDLQALVDAERTGQPAGDPFADFFLDYHPYDGGPGSITWYLQELETRYPGLASVFTIGNTPAGRPIRGIRVTSEVVAEKPAVLYFGAEHAREWVTTTVPTYFATYLLSQYGSDADITDLVDNVEFFLIPVLNVEGYEYSWTNQRLWRKNRRNNGDGTFGVDINRNWGEAWGGPGSSGSTGSQTYRGTGPFSEGETQLMRDFFLANPNVRAQLDIHSYSQLILWPHGYTQQLPVDQTYYHEVGTGMQGLIAGVHGLYYLAGPVYTAIYPASGVSIDWTYAQQGVLSYSFECRDTGFFGFELPANQIVPNNEELLPAMLHLSNCDWVRAPIRMEFPDGVPNQVIAGDTTDIDVRIVAQTDSLMPGTASVYYRSDGGAFEQAPLAQQGAEMFMATLPSAGCGQSPEFFFSAETVGGEMYTNPPGGETFTATVLSTMTTSQVETLSSDPGWTTQGLWAWGVPAGGGSHDRDPTAGATGSEVYGYNLNGDYANGMPATYLTSTPFDCTGLTGVSVRYQRWLGVESNSNFDQATIEVSNDGNAWTVVWRATDTGAAISDSSWTTHEVDISLVADDQPTVYLRWGMGPTDGGLTYPGWNIDDVEIRSAVCSAVPGDVNHDGKVDVFDILCVLDGFAGDFSTCALEDLDLVPCTDGDGMVDVFDILAVLDALAEQPFCP